LQAIKEHSLNFQENKYAMSIIYEAYNNLFTTKQRDTESLQEYTQRFKTATEMLETHTGGPIVLEKLINENMTDVKGLTDKEMMTRQVSDGFLAYLYLEQANKRKIWINFARTDYATIIRK
jgi:hypothetical protein